MKPKVMELKQLFIMIRVQMLNSTKVNVSAILDGVVEYAVCTSAEGWDSSFYECPEHQVL